MVLLELIIDEYALDRRTIILMEPIDWNKCDYYKCDMAYTINGVPIKIK